MRQYFSDKLNLAYRYTGQVCNFYCNYSSEMLNKKSGLYNLQDDKLKEEQLRIILESNILLDDHAATINDFFNGEQSSQYGQV